MTLVVYPEVKSTSLKLIRNTRQRREASYVIRNEAGSSLRDAARSLA
ncbi:MAG: hypothetical protein V7L22_33080 [Nostoc sp.]